MKRHCMAVAASICALALAPSTALADGQGGGLLGGLVSQTQAASNTNQTTQEANSTASNKQVNVNAPVSILSQGSNNGVVNQSNNGYTSSRANNQNADGAGKHPKPDRLC